MLTNTLCIGEKFYDLTVISEPIVEHLGHKHVVHKYLCECVCGAKRKYYQGDLVSGHVRSCGCTYVARCQPLTYNLTGQRFGLLTVISYNGVLRSDSGKSRMVRWLCRCDCGTELLVNGRSLRAGTTRSCGCYQKKIVSEMLTDNLIGQRFGKLTVIERSGSRIRYNSDSGKAARWRCRCDCGNEIIADGWSLKCGDNVSCGCMTVSRLESDVKSFLDENGYIENETYFRERTYDDLINDDGYHLYFDFVVLLSDSILVIECQGAQHYKSVAFFGGNEAFLRRLGNDKVKRNWVKEHNIKLLEIPYTACTQQHVYDILLNNKVVKLSN